MNGSDIFERTVDIDAYCVGDRQMEGCMFQVTITVDAGHIPRVTKIECDQDIIDWIASFGSTVNFWVDRLKEHLDENEMFEELYNSLWDAGGSDEVNKWFNESDGEFHGGIK